MEGSELLVNTTFGDARKGYDKAQVDGFLRALSEKWGELEGLLRQATQRAEGAEARAREAEDRHHESALALTEAQRRCAELDEALGEARAELSRDPAEVATGVLAMAQRTAEQTVADAEERSRQLIDDAEARASVITGDAEQRAERLAREADAELEDLRRSRLDDLEAEVATLTGRRDALAAEVGDLQAYVDGQRRRVRAAVEEIGRALAEDGPLALEEHPVLSTLPVRVRHAADDEPVPEPGTAHDALAAVDGAEGDTGPETAVHDVLGEDAPLEVPSSGPGGVWRASPIPDLLEGPGAPFIDLSDAVPPREPAVEGSEFVVDAMRWSDDEDDDLFAALDDGADEDPTAQDATPAGEGPGEVALADDGSPLGAPHADADAAMDEFFADETVARRRGRGRRR